MITAVETALVHSSLDTTGRQNYIKELITEIKIIPMSVPVLISPYVSGSVYIIENGTGNGNIRGQLNIWLTNNGVE